MAAAGAWQGGPARVGEVTLDGSLADWTPQTTPLRGRYDIYVRFSGDSTFR